MAILDIVVPDEQEGTKAIVRSWLVAIGQQVGENAPLVELETEKVTQEVPAPATGTLIEILLDSDAEAMPGALLGRMRLSDGDVDGAGEVAPEPSADELTAPAVAAEASAGAADRAIEHRLSPSVRRAVMRHAIEPGAIAGTGRKGRITMHDVEAAVARRDAQGASDRTAQVAPAAPAAAPSLAAGDANTATTAGGVTSIPHDRMRRAIADNMLTSVTVAPHVTAVFECDITAIFADRERRKAEFAKAGANLTYTAYFLAAAAQAMQVAPAINSRWHDDRLDLFDDVNIGVGTALGDRGLVVPVVRQCQHLSLLGIAHGLTDLTTRARAGALKPADMRGGTFTVSNHGVSGSLIASPIIINQPESAILGIGKTEKRVVVREIDGVDAIQIRPMAYVSLTIDHRVVDGHQTNLWLSRFVEVLETWA